MNDFDRIKRAFADLVRAVIPNAQALATYAGRFVSQKGQTGDITPDLADQVAGPVNAPFLYPFPGLSFTVDNTQSPRAVFGFVSGDPANPRIVLWENPGLQNWTLKADGTIAITAPAVNIGPGSPTLGAARATDPVAVAPSMASWITAVTAALAAVPAPATVPPPTDFGTIQSGSTAVKVS